MRPPPIDEADLLQLSDEAIIRYLLEVDQPAWTTLKLHERFGERWVIFFLKRNRAISRIAIQEIYSDRQLRRLYQVNLALLRCKSTPPPLAMNLVAHMRWMDLLNTLRSPTLPGPVRQHIETHLAEGLPRLALGEKITMARQAPRGLVKKLREAPEPRVIRALLNNYHFTYEDAMFLANYARITSEVLGVLAGVAKWRRYKEVRLALLRNPRTPNAQIVGLARSLQPYDLQRILKDPRLPTYPRRIIQKVLAEGPGTKEKP